MATMQQNGLVRRITSFLPIFARKPSVDVDLMLLCTRALPTASFSLARVMKGLKFEVHGKVSALHLSV